VQLGWVMGAGVTIRRFLSEKLSVLSQQRVD
jgi:hypothetical protein